MNIFSFRNQIIEDYSGYVSSFISIAQPRLRDFVDRCFTSGSLWPDPLIQLNSTFKPGKTVDELVREGVLEPGCSQVFRREKTAVVDSGEDLLFHQHQEEAIRKAKEGRNYVLTIDWSTRLQELGPMTRRLPWNPKINSPLSYACASS